MFNRRATLLVGVFLIVLLLRWIFGEGPSEGPTAERPTVPKILYFLHVHKSGGTKICESAHRGGYTANVDDNCNVFIRDGEYCCGDSIEEQQRVAPTLQYNFVANEGYMPSEMDLEHYEYMTVLRDPTERYISHYRFVRDVYYGPSVTGSFEDWVYHQPDNYFVRTICGNPCKNIPRGELGRAHIEQAKARLLNFKYIVILEDLMSTSRGLPFHVDNKRVNSNKKSAAKYHMEESLYMWDLELYEFAKYIVRVRLNRGIIPPTEICENECCGVCSIY
jgi:hypothetical protein